MNIFEASFIDVQYRIVLGNVPSDKASIIQTMAISVVFGIFFTTTLMLSLLGEILISVVSVPSWRIFETLLDIFLVHVALNASTEALGKSDLSSPMCENHLRNACFPSSSPQVEMVWNSSTTIVDTSKV